MGRLLKGPKVWRGSKFGGGSELLISQAEETEVRASPVWPWLIAKQRGRRSIPAGAATGPFVLLRLLTGGDRRGVLTGAHAAPRSPRLHRTVCKHKGAHARSEMCEHAPFFFTLPFSHTPKIHIKLSAAVIWECDSEDCPSTLGSCVSAGLQGSESQVRVELGYHTECVISIGTH